MKSILNGSVIVACITLAGASATNAAGLDLTGQDIEALFADGRYIEFGLASVDPSVNANIAGGDTGDFTQNGLTYGLAFKDDINEALSYALIFEKTFSREVDYSDGTLAVPFSYFEANATSHEVKALFRYKLNERFSVYGGPRISFGDVSLRGPNPFNPAVAQSVDLGTDTALGYTVGAAFEIPEYFIRGSLTYNSSIKHEFDTTFDGATIPGFETTDVTLPSSVNLRVQSPINQKTLLFANIRHVNWSETELAPGNSGDDILNGWDDSQTYTLGAAYRLNDTWALLGAIEHDTGTSKEIDGPLGIVTKSNNVSLGFNYTKGNMNVLVAARYIKFDDASGNILGAPASTSNNSAFGLAVKVGYNF